MSEIQDQLGAVLRHRAANNWRHLHHRVCIHNLPPLRQIELRGRTVEWWQTFIGALPVQITPDEWECEPPLAEPPTPPKEAK